MTFILLHVQSWLASIINAQSTMWTISTSLLKLDDYALLVCSSPSTIRARIHYPITGCITVCVWKNDVSKLKNRYEWHCYYLPKYHKLFDCMEFSEEEVGGLNYCCEVIVPDCSQISPFTYVLTFSSRSLMRFTPWKIIKIS